MPMPLSLDIFITKAKTIHNNKYGYEQVNYLNAHSKVTIICPAHGDFEQLANSHLQGHGCPLCKRHKLSHDRRFTKEEFLEKAKEIHSDKYDYSKVIYANSQIKVTIICPKHGKFEQIPNSHLAGHGCSKCYNEGISERIKYSNKDFIKLAKEKHNNYYNYFNTNYKHSQTKVCIICPDHGEFWQTPANHLAGNGCPICNSSKGEQAIKYILDKHNISYKREYRIPDQDYKFRYDFYLPEHNLLIEFHGIQHYEPVERFGGEEGFKDNKFRDMVKKELANQLKYLFLEFNYKQLVYMNNEEFEQYVLNKIIARNQPC